MLKRVEGHDADRIVELPRYQIGDDRFEICPLNVRLAIGGPKAAKAVNNQVDRLIRAVGHDRRGPARSRHTQTPQRIRTGTQARRSKIVPPQYGTDPGDRKLAFRSGVLFSLLIFEAIMARSSKLVAVKRGKVLLVRRRRDRQWMFPGGRKRARENDKDCLRREIREELPKLKLGRVHLWKEVKAKNRRSGRK
jgi:NUDIX domain